MKNKIAARHTTARDVTIGVLAAVLVLGFLFYAISNMSTKVTGHGLTGAIVAKNFVPQPEEQVTLGTGGLHERKLDGTYTFEIHVPPETKNYTVWVDKSVYDAHQIGDQFYFLLPPTTPAAR